MQKGERALRIFIGKRGNDGLHCLIAAGTGGKLLRPGRRGRGVMFRPTADGAGDGPGSRAAGRESLGVSDGGLRIEFGPASHKERKEHALFLRLGKSLHKGENFPHIFRVHGIGEFAEGGVGASASRMSEGGLDFEDDALARSGDGRW